MTSAKYQEAAGGRVEVIPLSNASHFNMLYSGDAAELKVEAAGLSLSGMTPRALTDDGVSRDRAAVGVAP